MVQPQGIMTSNEMGEKKNNLVHISIVNNNQNELLNLNRMPSAEAVPFISPFSHEDNSVSNFLLRS